MLNSEEFSMVSPELRITTNPELETLLVNMESMGLGITLKKR